MGSFKLLCAKKCKNLLFLRNSFIFEVLYLIVNQSYKAFWPAKR